MLQKGTQNGRRNGDIFNDILSFCGKWQTAFGLRLCSRIRVRAPCFHSLGLPWCPLFFQRFFDVFWGHPGTPKSAVGGRGGTQLIDYKNKALVTCTLIPCFRSATGASTGSLVGSSLEPAAGFMGSASAADLFVCRLVSITHGMWDVAERFREIWRVGGGLHFAMSAARISIDSFDFH